MSLFSTEPSTATYSCDFQVGITTDNTGNNNFRTSLTNERREIGEEFTYSGKARWLTHCRFPLPVATMRAKSFTLVEEYYYITNEEKRISFSEAVEKVISKDEKMVDFEKFLSSLRSKGLLKNEDDFTEILEQRKLLEKKRKTLSKYQGKVVVACGGELFVGNSLDEAVQRARKKYKDKPFYSESIGLIDVPSVYEP